MIFGCMYDIKQDYMGMYMERFIHKLRNDVVTYRQTLVKKYMRYEKGLKVR